MKRLAGSLLALGLAGISLPAGADCAGIDPDLRLVSVGGALTEIVYALGAQDHLVGVDTTSVYPPAAHDLPDVGYVRALPAEGVLSLSPTLVIAEDDAGPTAVLDQIRATGTPISIVPDDHTIEGAAQKIETVAGLLGCQAEGTAMAAALREDAAALAQALAGVEERPTVLFLLNIGQGTPMGGGANTSADGIIVLAGGRNALAAMEGYKPASAEAAIEADPDAILLTQGTVEGLGGIDAVLAMPQIALTRAGREGRVIVMDGLLLLGFGPRTVEAAAELAEALHGQDLAIAQP